MVVDPRAEFKPPRKLGDIKHNAKDPLIKQKILDY